MQAEKMPIKKVFQKKKQLLYLFKLTSKVEMCHRDITVQSSRHVSYVAPQI